MQIGRVKLCEKTIIGADHPSGVPLLERWILLRLPAFGIYLHHLCRSDYERALHDHPWPFVSIVLAGGYWEVHDQTIDGTQARVWRPVRSVALRPAEWRHRVQLPRGRTAWTLVIVGRRQRPWGFFLPTGWCWWRKHNYRLGICEDKVLWTGGGD